MGHWRMAIVAIVAAHFASAVLALSVDDCIRNCSVARGTCDFNPGDSVRSSICREQADACRYQCQLNGPSAGSRPTKFGAIAYSPSQRANGITYDFGDRASAERAALNACTERSRAKDCRVVIWFSNNCGALATASDGTYGGGYSGNKVGAESRAIQYCRNAGGRDCAIQRSFCTGRE